jgi:predicted transcriptional regulator
MNRTQSKTNGLHRPRGAGNKARHKRPDAVAMTLRGLRESTGRTQGEVARKVSMTQPQLSRVEARQDHLISTLRRYVHALGGEVEVVAVVNGARITLQKV